MACNFQTKKSSTLKPFEGLRRAFLESKYEKKSKIKCRTLEKTIFENTYFCVEKSYKAGKQLTRSKKIDKTFELYATFSLQG